MLTLQANLRYKPFVRCWKKELQLRADSEASGVDKAEVVDKSWGDWNAAVALGIQAVVRHGHSVAYLISTQTPRGGHLTTTNEPSAPSSLRSPYSASRAAQLDRERRVWREARDEWMLWRVVYRDTEEHPDPKDFPTHTCDNTRSRVQVVSGASPEGCPQVHAVEVSEIPRCLRLR